MNPSSSNNTATTPAWLMCLSAMALIAGAAAWRLIYLIYFCPLDLCPDEAHYWDWSRHLDWSYYSKGPLVAWLIHLSCRLFGAWSESLVGSQMVAVRLPAIVCGALLLLSLYILTVQVFRRHWLAFGVVALASTVPLISAGSLLMTIDAPYTCCWGWSLVLAYQAVMRRSQWAWPLLGLVLGAGMLAKYTMILFLPSLGLFLLLTPDYRRVIWSSGLWLAVVIAGACCLPIIIWNMQHGWVSLFHLQGQAGVQRSAATIYLLGPLTYVGTQFALLLGFWFVLWVRAMFGAAPWRKVSDAEHYLWWMSAPMFVFFFLFSWTTKGGEPNWPVTAYLSGMVLAAGWLAQRWFTMKPLSKRLWAGGVVFTSLLGLALTTVVHQSEIIYPLLGSLARAQHPGQNSRIRQFDPTCRLRGWQQLGHEVEKEIDRLRGQGIQPIVAAGYWNVPGELAFYCEDHPQVYSLGLAVGTRHSQYDLWHPNPIHDPSEFRGRTFIYVGDPNPLLQQGVFQKQKSTHQFRVRVQDHQINSFQISVFEGFKGFPKGELHAGKY